MPDLRPGRVAALCALALLVGATVSLPAAAADAPPGYGYALAHELMSPFCPGRTLAACPSDKAAEVRQWILVQEAAGTSRQEVIDILHQRFGDVILSSPDAEGWGLAAWLLPVVALVAGAGVVVLVLRRMTRGGGAGAAATPASAPPRPSPQSGPEDADLARIVDEELRASGA